MVRFDTPQRRVYVCNVCGAERKILTKPLEKWTLVCVHQDTTGKMLPVMQLREEGKLITDG